VTSARRDYEQPPINYPPSWQHQAHDPFQMIGEIERELLGSFFGFGGHHDDLFSRLERGLLDDRDIYKGLYPEAGYSNGFPGGVHSAFYGGFPGGIHGGFGGFSGKFGGRDSFGRPEIENFFH
jgi:hypothetical protein